MSPDQTLRRLAAVLAVAVAALLGGAAPGWAHAAQISVYPADGSVIPQVPGAVVVTFNEEPQQLGTQATAQGPDGPVETTVTLSGNTVEIGLPDDAPAGRYTVRWRVTSSDGHPIQGSSTFQAEQAAAPGGAVGEPTRTPDPAAAGTDPGRSPGGGRTGDPATASPTSTGTGNDAVAVGDATATNGSRTINADESPADRGEDGAGGGLSGTAVLLIGLLVALGGGAGVWLALVRRRKG